MWADCAGCRQPFGARVIFSPPVKVLIVLASLAATFVFFWSVLAHDAEDIAAECFHYVRASDRFLCASDCSLADIELRRALPRRTMTTMR